MSNATNNTSGGTHNGHWTTTATKSGTYEFATGGKYVDRNIDLVVPQAEETVSGSGSVTIPVSVGTKDANNKYPFTGTKTATGTATATVGTKGFTDSNTYTGNVSISGGVSGTMDAIGLSASGSGSAEITTVSVGTKSGTNYPVTGSATGTGTATASVSTSGYGKAGVETGNGDVSVSASLNASIPAASATVTASGTASSPTVAIDTANDNISVGTITTTKPSSGYYAAVKATAPKTTVTQTVTVGTNGYLGNKSEITASGEISAKTGVDYYVPITGASVTKGTTTVSGTTATRGTLDISEGYISGTSGDLPAATFKNTATSGKSYVDISGTTDAPILISDDYLYIDQGYTDNLKISLARLVPDLEGYEMAGSGDLLAGKTLYDKDGKPVTGTIETKTSANMTVSGATVTVPAGYYATSQSKSVASGSVNSFSIDETTQGGVLASVSATTPTDGYFPVSVASLKGTVNRTAGYISGTSSTASDSNGGVVGKIVASTTSKTDGTATANANTTHNLTSGTYATSATTGYTYHVDATASASTTAASISAGVGYVGTAIEASTTAASSGNKSSKIYILDSTSKIGTTAITSGSTIGAGETITIGKGYYPTDRTFTAQSAENALTTSNITGTLSTSITSGYTAPTLVNSAVSGTPYVTIAGNGSMTKGNIYSGTATAKTQYMEVYAGTYSIA